MFCPRCGKENDDKAKYCQACGNGLQPAITPSPTTGVASYAAFWERFVAQVIDVVILSVATGTVFTATFGAGMPFGTGHEGFIEPRRKKTDCHAGAKRRRKYGSCRNTEDDDIDHLGNKPVPARGLAGTYGC